MLTDKDREDIKRISEEFASGFLPDIKINGSGWLIADPLSAYLNTLGYENTLSQIPESENNPLTLILTFSDGAQFIPAGKDLNHLDKRFKNYMWAV